MLFPNIIEETAKGFNNAWVLVEVNDIGEQVANILHYDLEYDNMLMASMRGRNGQVVGHGFSGKKSQMGVRTTAQVKNCLLYTSPSPRDYAASRMPSSA